MDIRTRYNVTKSRWFCCLAWVWGHSLAGVAGSNPAGVNDVFFYEYFVLSRTGLYKGPIPLVEKSFRVSFAWVWSWNLESEETLAQSGRGGRVVTPWNIRKKLYCCKTRPKKLAGERKIMVTTGNPKYGVPRDIPLSSTLLSDFASSITTALTLVLLTWTIWRAPTNASKWRMGFNPCPAYVDKMASSYQC